MKWPVVSLLDTLASAEVFVDGDWVESKDQDPEGDVRLVQLADVGDGKYVDKSDRFLTSAKARELRCTFLKPGDVLVARMPDPLGRACIFPGDSKPSVTVVDVCIIRPDSRKHDARWLMHCLNAPDCRNEIAGYATGTTRSRISRGNLGKVRIPLPPLREQRRIAEILDKADALRAKRRAALAQLDTLTQSIFLDMFGDPATNPKGWDASTIDDVSEKVTDGEHLTPKREASGIKLLSARNVRDGRIDLSQVDYVGPDEYARIAKRCDPRRGDVLISCSGTVGRVAPVETDEPFALVRSAAMVRPKQARVRTKFLELYLRMPSMQRQMLRRANASSQANLFQGQIRELPVLVPPLSLQESFDNKVARVESLRKKSLTSGDELTRLFQSIQQRVFRGELVDTRFSEALA